MILKKNDEIKLEITAFTSMGSGIGRFESMAVLLTVLHRVMKLRLILSR